MGIFAHTLAGGAAGGFKAAYDTYDRREQMDEQLGLLARKQDMDEAYANKRDYKYLSGDNKRLVSIAEFNAMPEEERTNFRRIEMAQLEADAAKGAREDRKLDISERKADLQEQRLNAILAGKKDKEERGQIGKEFDDLTRIFGDKEKAAQYVADKYSGKGKGAGGSEKVFEDKDGGGVMVYDPETSTLRHVYTPEEAERIGSEQAQSESTDAGKGLFNLEWDDEKKQQRAAEIKAGLLKGGEKPGGVNNNVGGMRPVGKSTGFQSFESVDESLKAIDANLKAYGDKHGIDTLEGVISRWSPEKDGNDTQTLISNASKVTGIKPGQKIDLSNPAVRTVIAAAIIRQEGSGAYLDGVRGQKQQSAGSIGSAEKNTERQPASGGKNYGDRADGTKKGPGYFGELEMRDGSVDIATEISIGVEMDGKEVQIPTLVPTLTEQEKDYLLKGGDPTKSSDIIEKAISFARERISAGKSPFADNGGGVNDVMNDQKSTPAKSEQTGKGLLDTVASSDFMTGSVDAGAMMGKPVAAVGEMMGDTVKAAISLVEQATKQRVSDADIDKIKQYALKVNDPEQVANAFLALGGSPAKNTEKYMQRTSTKNLNQYFR